MAQRARIRRADKNRRVELVLFPICIDLYDFCTFNLIELFMKQFLFLVLIVSAIYGQGTSKCIVIYCKDSTLEIIPISLIDSIVMEPDTVEHVVLSAAKPKILSFVDAERAYMAENGTCGQPTIYTYTLPNEDRWFFYSVNDSGVLKMEFKRRVGTIPQGAFFGLKCNQDMTFNYYASSNIDSTIIRRVYTNSSLSWCTW